MENIYFKNFLFSSFDFITISSSNTLVFLTNITLENVIFKNADFLREFSNDLDNSIK